MSTLTDTTDHACAEGSALGHLTRRRFLQAATAGATVATLPGWLADAAAASTPTGPSDGIVVLVTLTGGMDGLHAVPPVGRGAYHDARGDLALQPADTLHLDGGRALHPRLAKLHQRWQAGQLAIIDGVGAQSTDMSHFSAMDDLQHGTPITGKPASGWLGRYLDAFAEGYQGISLGSSLPVVARGAHRRAVTLPVDASLVPPRSHDRVELHRALDRFGRQSHGLGVLGQRLAGEAGGMMTEADTFRGTYPGDRSQPDLALQMMLAAKVVNANLGARFITLEHGTYDGHARQGLLYDNKFSELDHAVDRFFLTLDPAMAARTTVLIVSEFGRRVAANGSMGTDHGGGNVALAVGQNVIGGFHGEMPSLTNTTWEGNLRHTIEFSDVFAHVLDQWLGADAATVLGTPGSGPTFLRAPGS